MLTDKIPPFGNIEPHIWSNLCGCPLILVAFTFHAQCLGFMQNAPYLLSCLWCIFVAELQHHILTGRTDFLCGFCYHVDEDIFRNCAIFTRILLEMYRLVKTMFPLWQGLNMYWFYHKLMKTQPACSEWTLSILNILEFVQLVSMMP